MTRRNLALLLIGFIAGIASVKSYPMTTGMILDDGEIWRRTFEITRDPNAIDAQGRELMIALQQQANRYPRETLVLSCSLTHSSVRTQAPPRADRR